MMSEKTIKVTLESLFDLVRREKNREELQKVDDSFFDDVVQYLQEKRMMLESQQKSLMLFSEADKEKSQLQFNSIRRLIKELYDRREKKIIAMALYKAKVDDALMDTGSM